MLNTTSLSSSSPDTVTGFSGVGYWYPTHYNADFSPAGVLRATSEFRRPAAILFDPDRRRIGVGLEGEISTKVGSLREGGHGRT